jgi:competence protein ComFC
MNLLHRISGSAGRFLRAAGDAALGLFYPPHCAACGADTPAGSHLCAACAKEVRQIAPPFCRGCSQPFAGAITGEFVCSDCRERDFQFTCAVSRYRAEGIVRDFVHRFKYERHFYLRHQLAAWLAHGLEDERLREPAPQLLVPVPLHPARQREREFNQAEVLAKLVSARSGIPAILALKRTRYTTTQTRLERSERMQNLRGAFCLRKGSAVGGSHLVLIDDVFTTGSTAEECARVLRKAGAASVRVLTVARAVHF